MAIYRRYAFPNVQQWQVFRFMHPRRGPGREKRPSLATHRRCVSKTSRHWQDMRAMHPKSAANRLSGMHSAHILPGRGPFRRTGPSNHTWGADLARGPHCTGPRILPGSPHCTDPSPQIIHDVRISLGSPPSLHRSLKSCIVRRSCHPLAIFAFRWRGVLP